MSGRKGRREAEPADFQIARFLRSDPHLIAEIRSHVERIVQFKGYYIPETERQDIVQDVMAQLWQALTVREVKVTRSLMALTETIASRRCVDWVRRLRRLAPVDPEAPDRSRRPDETLLDRERQDQGRRVLASLQAPCRELIRLVLDDGTPYSEIAREQGRSEHALRTKMWQCLKEAREILRRMTEA